MVISQRIQWHGLAAMLGGVLGILVAPVLTFAGWLAGPAGAPPTMAWARFMQPIILPLVTFGDRVNVLRIWGSTGLLIYLLFLVGLLDLHTRVCGHGGRLERLGFQLARVGLVMNVGGNIADYWLGRETLGQGLWGAGFTIGTMLGTLVYTIGAVLLGSAILRTGALPRWTGVVLILAPLLGVSMLFWGVRYIPANFILGNSIGWVVIGYVLQSDKGSEALLLGAS